MTVMTRPMTVGDLRHALDGLPADRLVQVDARVLVQGGRDGWVDGTLEDMTVLGVREVQRGAHPPHVMLLADGGVLA